jgi:hypothetical protein
MTETFTSAVVVRALGWALLQSLWQGVVIGLAAAVVLAALGRAAPSLRYLVACGALLAMVLVTGLTAGGAVRELRAPAAPLVVGAEGGARAPAPVQVAPAGTQAPAMPAAQAAAPVAGALGQTRWVAPAVLAWGEECIGSSSRAKSRYGR